MTAPHHAKLIKKWVAIYLGVCLLGTAILYGVLQPQALDGWAWWKHLLLILLAGPVVVALMVIVEGVLEGGFHLISIVFKENPLQTIIAAVAIGTLLWVAWSLAHVART